MFTCGIVFCLPEHYLSSVPLWGTKALQHKFPLYLCSMVEYFPQASTQDQNSVSSDSYIPPCPQMSFTPQIANFLLYSLNYELFKVRRTEYHIQLKAKSHERKDKVGKKIHIFYFLSVKRYIYRLHYSLLSLFSGAIC